MSTFLNPGTYMTATLRDEDMLDMFGTIAALTDCKWCRGETTQARRALDAIGRYNALEDPCECSVCDKVVINHRETVSEAIAYLFDHVNEHHVPEGMYFGSIEGDGACFGVWANEPELTFHDCPNCEGHDA